MHDNSSHVEIALNERMEKLASEERFEEASEYRDRFHAFIHGVSRGHRIRSLTRLPRLLVAKRIETGWE
jgi:DNA polymerase-3 subunit epsilon